jgi:O-antigen ligase
VALTGREVGVSAVGRARWLYPAGLVLFALLLFIYSVPHTVSLRYLLLLGAMGVFGYLAVKRGNPASLSRLTLPAVLFAALSFWIVIGALFISDDPMRSLSETRGQWLMVLLSLITGVAAAMTVETDHSARQQLLAVVITVLLIHVLIVDVQSLWSAIPSNNLQMSGQGLTAGPDKASFLTNILLAFLLSELFLRLTGKPRTLRINNVLFAAILVLALLSLYAEGRRNAVLALFVMGIGFIVLYWISTGRNQRQWRSIAVASCLFVVLVISLFHATASKRGITWDQMMDTLPVALDTQGHKNWLNIRKYGLPMLSNGKAVEESTYLRVAWLKEGLLLVVEHPLGIGFDRNAFGRGLQLKYGEGRGHSHSGLLDIAIGTGVPGVVLWMVFLGSLAWLGWRRFLDTGSYAGLALLFVILDFSTRLLLDSVTKDHMLQQFVLVAGLLAVQAAGASRPKEHAR